MPGLRSARGGNYHAHLRDEGRIDAVERLIPLADEAGLPLTRLAIAFTLIPAEFPIASARPR
jgi:hypothetical protein